MLTQPLPAQRRTLKVCAQLLLGEAGWVEHCVQHLRRVEPTEGDMPTHLVASWHVDPICAAHQRSRPASRLQPACMTRPLLVPSCTSAAYWSDTALFW